MKKTFPKHTDPAEEFRKICDRAYVYERDEKGRLLKRRAGQIFVMCYRTEDEILSDIWDRQCQKLCEGTAYIKSRHIMWILSIIPMPITQSTSGIGLRNSWRLCLCLICQRGIILKRKEADKTYANDC